MLGLQQSLPMLLYRTLDAVMPRFRDIFNQFGVTEQQWRVLRALWECDQLSLSALAEVTLITPPSLVGVVDRLSRKGLVARRRSGADRRIVHICMTGSGRALEAQVRPALDAVYAQLQDSIEPELWQQLSDSLEQLTLACSTAPMRTSALKRKSNEISAARNASRAPAKRRGATTTP
jgi:homoprotocatechuate degradation regulator HpaR